MKNTGESEKCSAQVRIVCKPSEKRRWMEAFGPGELSRTIKRLLNQAAARIR